MKDFSESIISYALYLRYKDEQPCWPFIGCAFALGTISFFGMAFNSALIFVTIHTRTLNGTTSYLLAFNAALELMHQYVYFTFLYLCLTGQQFIDYKFAVQIAAPAIFGYSGIFPAMLCTGVDRLICVLFPFFHKTVNKMKYLAILFTSCVAFSVYSVITIFITSESIQNMYVTGFEADLYQGDLANHRKNIIFVFIVCTIVVYLVTGAVIHKRAKIEKQTVAATIIDKRNRKFFYSLSLVISVHIVGYLFMYIYGIFVMPKMIAQNSLILAWFGVVLLAVPLNLCSMSIAPILFVTSAEYRKAFQSEWRRIIKAIIGICRSSSSSSASSPKNAIIFVNAVHPVQPMNIVLQN